MTSSLESELTRRSVVVSLHIARRCTKKAGSVSPNDIPVVEKTGRSRVQKAVEMAGEDIDVVQISTMHTHIDSLCLESSVKQNLCSLWRLLQV